MKKEQKLGMNRTGCDTSPIDSKVMAEGAQSLTKAPPGDALAISDNRIMMMEETGVVGSVPPPGTVKGALKSTLQIAKGKDPVKLIDKLGERAAFERAGVRIYDALISKHQAFPELAKAVPLDQLREFREEEHRHFDLVTSVIRQLGADPTAMTPSADIAAVASMGVQKVATDARISFSESLNAILIAELVDNDSWAMLIELVQDAGLDEVAASFTNAYENEQKHLAAVRAWVNELMRPGLAMSPQLSQKTA